MLTIAVTHRLPDQSEERIAEQLSLIKERLIAIGTKVRGLSESQMDGNARRDMDILRRAGEQGALAVVRYELGAQSLLVHIEPQPQFVRAEGLHCLAYCRSAPLSPNLAAINTMGLTIRELPGAERERVVEEARCLGWS